MGPKGLASREVPLVREQMLSKSRVEFYRAHGYLVVEGVLTNARIAALRTVADRWVEAFRAV